MRKSFTLLLFLAFQLQSFAQVPFNFPPIDTLTSSDCQTAAYCMEGVERDRVFSGEISISLNGSNNSLPLFNCDFRDIYTYNIDSLLNSGPLTFDVWSVNGVVFSGGTFSTIQGLADLLNQYDPTGQWTIANNTTVMGGNLNSTYDFFRVINSIQNSYAIVPFLVTEPFGSRFNLPMGSHDIIVVDNTLNYSDSVTVIVECESISEITFQNVPQDITVECDAVPSAATITATTTCQDSLITAINLDENISNGTCAGSYIITRHWQAYDNCNESNTVIQTITVVDNTGPILIGVPSDITIDETQGQTIPLPGQPTATDNCDPNVVITLLESQGNNTASGYTVFRTWIATDNCGNAVESVQFITVIADSTSQSLDSLTVTGSQIICEGQTATIEAFAPGVITYQWSNGMNTSTININPLQTTTYSVTATDGNGNTAVESITVVVDAVSFTDFYLEICEGETVTMNNIVYSSATVDTLVLTSVNGCDSIVTVYINVLPVYTQTIQEFVCEADSAGTFVQTFVSQSGCDSIVTLEKIFQGGQPLFLNQGVCDSALVRVDTMSYTTLQGCDSTVIIDYYFTMADDTTWTQFFTCDPNLVGIVTNTFTNIYGCDSLVTVETLFQTVADSTVVQLTTCDSSLVGTLIDTLTAINGCDSIVTTITTFEQAINTYLELVTCDSTQMGTITETFTAVNGCDSIVTTFTTFEETQTTILSEVSCDSSLVGTTTEVLTGINGCDSIIITNVVLDTCVTPNGDIWPGDTDSTNVVDIYDIFNIGFGFGETGPARTNATGNWVGQAGMAWTNNSPYNNVNYRHADCNGDGVIDEKDADVVLENFELSHNFQNDPNIPTIRNEFPISLDNATITPDGWATVEVLLGNELELVQDFYGVSFTFLYDNNRVSPNTMTFELNNSWAGAASDTEIIKAENETHLDGQFEVAVVRTTQQGVSGQGSIGSLRFKMPDNTGGDFRMKIEGSTKIGSTGVAQNGETGIIDVELEEVTTGVEDMEALEQLVKVFPIPANQFVRLEIDPQLEANQWQLFNLNGQLIKEARFNDKALIINTENIPSGLYLLQVNTAEGRVNKRLSITH